MMPPTSNLQPQTVLVTGVAGFIGSNLAERLLKVGGDRLEEAKTAF